MLKVSQLVSLFLFFSTPLFSADGLQRLMEGNRRYVEGNPTYQEDAQKKREETLVQQTPFAVVVGCSDSRVPPELIFDQHIGDLFIVRVAGNVVGPLETDSIEFAAEILEVPLILVLGHESCGAVEAVIKGEAPQEDIENIAPLIQPAVDQARKLPGDIVENSIKANVRLVMNTLQTNSVLAPAISEGKLKLVGGYYRMESGVVEVLK